MVVITGIGIFVIYKGNKLNFVIKRINRKFLIVMILLKPSLYINLLPLCEEIILIWENRKVPIKKIYTIN